MLLWFSLELLDRIEPPQIQDGYGLSVALLTMLRVVKCVTGVIDGTAKDLKEGDASDERTWNFSSS